MSPSFIAGHVKYYKVIWCVHVYGCAEPDENVGYQFSENQTKLT